MALALSLPSQFSHPGKHEANFNKRVRNKRALELELELILSQMAQKPMLRGEVGLSGASSCIPACGPRTRPPSATAHLGCSRGSTPWQPRH